MTSVVWTDVDTDLERVAERLSGYNYDAVVKNGAVHLPRDQLPISARLSEQLARDGMIRDNSEMLGHVAFRPREDVR